MKACASCGATISRRENEQPGRFAKRRTCSFTCSGKVAAVTRLTGHVPRSREEKLEYLRRYYQVHPEKYRRNPEKQAKHNEKRRAQYAADPSLRAAMRAQARDWARRNPDRHKESRLRLSYGITFADYQRMLTEQLGGCAICGAAHCKDFDPRSGKPRKLHVDHCHATGAVRGLLCSNCNKAIGLFHDAPERLRAAAAYLERTAK